MRLFIALAFPNELHEWLAEQQKELKRFLPQAGLRWTASDQWHITLRFLGEWPEHKTAAALTAMNRAAEEMPPFFLSLGKPGIFSGPRMGVLWMSVESGSEFLASLAGRLNKSLYSEGFPKEMRRFSSACHARAQSAKNFLDGSAQFSSFNTLSASLHKSSASLSKYFESKWRSIRKVAYCSNDGALEGRDAGEAGRPGRRREVAL